MLTATTDTLGFLGLGVLPCPHTPVSLTKRMESLPQSDSWGNPVSINQPPPPDQTGF